MRVLCTAVLMTLLAFAGPVAGRSDEKKGKASTTAADVVATIGEKAITGAEVEEMARERLARLRNEEYAIKRQVLEEYLTRTSQMSASRVTNVK